MRYECLEFKPFSDQRKVPEVSDDLPKIRSQTMTCLEASEGKGGAVVLKIADRPKYDTLKESIQSYQEQITGIEGAIRELDSLHAGFLDEMRSTRSALAGTEPQQRQMLSTWASSAIQRGANSRKSVEEILAHDSLYQERKAKVESQITTAKKAMDALIPQIEKIEEILSSVGC